MFWRTDDPEAYPDPLTQQALPSVSLSYQELEEAVDAWRPQLTVHYPFVAIAEAESTKMLIVDRPFLSTAIAVAALYGDLPRQLETAQGLIKDIGMAMLLEGKKSLDLLQGLLVLLAWCVVLNRFVPSIVIDTSFQVPLPCVQKSSDIEFDPPGGGPAG